MTSRLVITYGVGMGFPGISVVKYPPACSRHRRLGFTPWVGKIPWRRKWQPAPVFLAGKSHGQRSRMGHIVPGVTKESDRT